MSEVCKWLGAIGLAQYADAFEANDIDMELLPQVDDQTLKDSHPDEAQPRSVVGSSGALTRFCRAADADDIPSS